MKMVYVCEDSFEGILCGVYDAFMGKKGHSNVKLAIAGQGDTMELFCEYQDVPLVMEKAEKVIHSVRTRISEDAYEVVYKASLSREGGRADCIYRFLIYGFHIGRGVTDMLQIPEVFRVFEMCRYLDNEAHLFKEFLRFVEMDGGFLVSKIGPKNDVLVLMVPHFADRLPEENFIIYDEIRKKAAIHPAGRPWFLMNLASSEWEDRLQKAIDEDCYETLWKVFRKSIAIQERRNYVCQRNHMPLRYRVYMPEYSEKLTDD